MYADAHRDLLVDGATAAEDDGTAASDTARQPPSLPRVLAVFRNPAEQVCGRLTRKGQVRGGGACVDAIAELPHPPPPLPPAASAEERAARALASTRSRARWKALAAHGRSGSGACKVAAFVSQVLRPGHTGVSRSAMRANRVPTLLIVRASKTVGDHAFVYVYSSVAHALTGAHHQSLPAVSAVPRTAVTVAVSQLLLRRARA